LYAEDGLAGYLAKKTGRPVKWIEGRRENMAATIHGRDQIDEVELALKNDGTILGMRIKAIADLGGFYSLFTPMIPTLTDFSLRAATRFRPSSSIKSAC
jgi:carbon-monoxide dehydrogenase large subunit